MKSSKNLIKNKNAKIMIVSEEFATEVESLSRKMKTNPKDVISAAVELLKLSLSREVILRKPDSDIEIKLPLFKSIDPEIKVEGE